MWTMQKYCKKTLGISMLGELVEFQTCIFFTFGLLLFIFKCHSLHFFPTIELEPNKETSFLDILQLYLCQFYRTSFLKEIIRDGGF